MKALSVIAIVLCLLFGLLVPTRHFNLSAGPQDELLAYELTGARPLVVSIPGGVQDIQITSWLLPPAGASETERFEYEYSMTVLDEVGQSRIIRRSAARSQLPERATEVHWAELDGGPRQVCAPRTAHLDVSALEGHPGRLRLKMAQAFSGRLLLRLSHGQTRTDIEQTLVDRTLGAVARQEMVANRSSLGFLDVPEDRRRGALSTWQRRLTAVGREGLQYATVRLLLGRGGDGTLTQGSDSDELLTSPFQRLPLIMTDALTLRVHAPAETRVLWQTDIGMEEREAVVTDSGYLDLQTEDRRLQQLTVWTAHPEQIRLTVDPAAASKLLSGQPAFWQGERLRVAPDVRSFLHYRAGRDRAVRFAVLPGQQQLRITLRAAEPLDSVDKVLAASNTRRGRIHLRWVNDKQQQVAEQTLSHRGRISAFTMEDGQMLLTEAETGLVGIPPGATTLELRGNEGLRMRVTARDPSVEASLWAPPYDVTLNEDRAFASAPMHASRWAGLLADNHEELVLAQQVLRFKSAVRLVPKRSWASLPETVLRAWGSSSQRQFVTAAPGQWRSDSNQLWTAVRNGETAGIAPSRTNHTQVLTIADEDRLGQSWQLFADGVAVLDGPLQFTRFEERWLLEAGKHEIEPQGLGARGMVLVRAPPASGQTALKSQNTYPLKVGGKLVFGVWIPPNSSNSVVIQATVPRSTRAVEIAFWVDGGRPRAEEPELAQRRSKGQGSLTLIPDPAQQAEVWGRGPAVARDAWHSQTGALHLKHLIARNSLPLGTDLKPGLHRLTLELANTERSKLNPAIWLRAIHVGQHQVQ